MKLWTLLLIASLQMGCLAVKLQNSERLMNLEGFEAAAQASPDWCREVLKTINALEEIIERNGVQ